MTRTMGLLRTAWVASALTVAAGSLVLSHSAQADDDDDGKTEIEGKITGKQGTCPNITFSVGKTRVQTNQGTDFDDGTCASIKNGTRVEVDGHKESNGTLVAHEVDID